ncbi:MAG: MBL fold metallo-hydrolase [Planctomycetes bacterium]|nr:MBL fold metallo-hydrolase [Planctomycetota bacterium]MCB9892237.1 MBL fold metallo-hydrolase [Planctomycetota bacterium]
MNRLYAAGFAFVGLLAPPSVAQDAESAKHAFEAATPQVSFEERHGDVVLRQYQLGCLSQLTYLLGSNGEALVVDPQRDVEHYLRDARELGLRITKVFLTHTNADFVAGHTELAARVGAEILISEASQSKFAHHGLHDGEQVVFGKARLTFWETPGHTLDAMCMLIAVPDVEPDPAYVITGDTLFIGGIGRPDLVGGDVTPAVLANRAYDSMQRLLTLPDGARVLPAHGAGSLCGAHLSPETVSTIGAERRTNPYLQPLSRAAFVAKVVVGLPIAPQYFAHNVTLNREGPKVLAGAEHVLPQAFEPPAFSERLAQGAWSVDLRDPAVYAAGHVKGAVNIAVRGRLDTWTGTVVPWDADVLLIGTDEEVSEAAFRLKRIGYDHVVGYLKGGMEAWSAAALPVRSSRLVKPQELADLMQAKREPMIVDVRTRTEFEELRLGDFTNIPVTDWQSFRKALDPAMPVLMVCNSAYRSSMAVGLAEREGFVDVGSLDGGMDAWLTQGLPALGTASESTSGSSIAAPGMILPEPMEPSLLARVLLDQPGSYAVIDVRPVWQFDEYHVPGAVRVEPGAVRGYVTSLPVGVRPVLVDRDGTMAFAIAGIVFTQMGAAARDVRVLSGGTQRFHLEIELGRSMGASVMPPPIGIPTPAIPTPGKVVPNKRSAGC